MIHTLGTNAVDQMDLMMLHEQYQPPAVGVGEVVLVRLRGRHTWMSGTVEPPQVTSWKPGDPLGKRITVYVPKLGRLLEDLVHVGDPLHVNSPEIYHTAWECCTPGKVQNVQGSLIELQGRLNQTTADLGVVQDLVRNQDREISKLKAAQSFRHGKKEKELEPAAA